MIRKEDDRSNAGFKRCAFRIAGDHIARRDGG
jgi:hypothetical protein